MTSESRSYPRGAPGAPGASASARLESWKQIAAYLGRDVRTAQRWERGEGLPVHRHQHGSRGTVFAYAEEVDAWLAGRCSPPVSADVADSDPGPGKREAPAAVVQTRERHGAWRGPRPSVLTAVVGLALLGLIVTWITGGAPEEGAAAEAARLLVLPLTAIGDDPLEEATGRALHEELITGLAALAPERLSVIGRTSALRYGATGLGLAELGEVLGVAHVLEGSVRRRAGELQVVARLVDAPRQSEVWSGAFALDPAHLADGERRVAQRVTQALADELFDPPLRGPGAASHGAPTVPDPEARAAWLRGRYLWHKGTRAGFGASLAHFEQALSLDPDYADAHVGLASAYALLGRYGARAPHDVFPKALDAAHAALALDPSSAEAHTALALVHFYYEWDFQAAAREFQTALRLGPGLALAHHAYAHFLSCLGLHEQGLAAAAQARALEPLWPLVIADTAWFHYRARDFERAVAESRRALELEPGMESAVSCLVESLRRLGDDQAAWAEMRAHLDASGRLARIPGIDGEEPGRALRSVRHWLRLELERVATERFVPVHAQVFSLSDLGRDDEMLEWLHVSLETRDRVALLTLVHPAFDGLRGDPRFRSFVARVGFPENPAELVDRG